MSAVGAFCIWLAVMRPALAPKRRDTVRGGFIFSGTGFFAGGAYGAGSPVMPAIAGASAESFAGPAAGESAEAKLNGTLDGAVVRCLSEECRGEEAVTDSSNSAVGFGIVAGISKLQWS